MLSEPVAYDAASRFDVTGKNVLITGAAHGLGLAMATGFIGAGARVALLDVEGHALTDVEKELSSHGTVCSSIADLRDDAAVRSAVEDSSKALGGLDVVINNAAIFPTGRISEMETDVFVDALNVNLAAYARTVKAAHKDLVASASGRVINFASVMFFTGHPPHLVAYTATKAGAIGFTRGLARELGVDGITVNAIAPGAFPTRAETQANEDAAAFNDEMLGVQSLKRRGSVGDIAAVALFLASDAASFITGQTILVDGGWMFH